MPSILFRLLAGLDIHQYPLVFRIPARDSEHGHGQASKPYICFVQLILELPLECWPVQEWELAVEMPKKKVYEIFRQIMFWEFTEKTRKVVWGGDMSAFPDKFPL